jgi:hypothetical protein
MGGSIMNTYDKVLKRMKEYGWRDFSSFDTLGLINLHLEKVDTIFEETDDESLAFVLDFMRALLEVNND